MNMEYKIGIIIPVYNAIKTLDAAVRSIRKQTIGFRNVQVILADDHSNDGSFERAQKLAARYQNITVVQTKQNSGSASAPRNLGLQLVEAPHVMFLDNDDMLDLDACRVLYEEAEKTSFDLIAGSYSEIHYGRKTRAVPYYDTVQARDFDFPAEMPDFRPIADPFWCKLFSTALIREHNLRFESGLYGEDTLFMLRYLTCCKTGRHIKANIYNYRIRDNSLFHIFDKEHIFGALVGDRRIREVLINAGQQKYYHEYLEDHLSQMMDVIANADKLSDDDIPEVMLAWAPYFKIAVEQGFTAKNLYGEILLEDARRGEYDRQASHMLTLRALCREKNAAMQDILRSRGWRAIEYFNRLLAR